MSDYTPDDVIDERDRLRAERDRFRAALQELCDAAQWYGSMSLQEAARWNSAKKQARALLEGEARREAGHLTEYRQIGHGFEVKELRGHQGWKVRDYAVPGSVPVFVRQETAT